MTDSANQNQSTDDQGSGFAKKLDGRRIAVLAGQGVEQVELTDPMRAIRAAGGTPVIVSYSEGSFVAMKGDWEHADSFAVDVDVNEAEVEPFDALVLPGGTLNADAARIEEGVPRDRPPDRGDLPRAVDPHRRGPGVGDEADVVRVVQGRPGQRRGGLGG